MERKLLILCDPEEDYVRHMADFLCRKKESGWEIRTFTKPEELRKAELNIEILLIAESVYEEFGGEVQAKVPILLNESGVISNHNVLNVDKYQPAEKVWQEILLHYIEHGEEGFLGMKKNGEGRLIGMYSPVRRCLQTTFALTYAHLLAETHRTLYLSFEHYSGIEEWQVCKRQDLATLLYYQQDNVDNFLLHMQTLVCKQGNLDCVMPMLNGENLLYVSLADWQKLLNSITGSGIYDYVILDLSESIQGLFEILRMCSKVYTIVQDEKRALHKLYQYEQLLALQEYPDVKEKTAKCHLPLFRKLPTELDQYTRGELAEYIRGMLRKEKGDDVSGMEAKATTGDFGETGLWKGTQ